MLCKLCPRHWLLVQWQNIYGRSMSSSTTAQKPSSSSDSSPGSKSTTAQKPSFSSDSSPGSKWSGMEDSSPGPKWSGMKLSGMRRIESLNIKEELEKLPMQPSFISHLFLGVCDGQFVAFPKILKSRDELKKLNDQKKLIDKYFANISCDEPSRLKEFGFNDVWNMSMSEQVAYFEAMGGSCYKDSRGEAIMEKEDKNTKRPLTLLEDDPTLSLNHFTNMVKLVIRNCLVFPLFNCTTNEAMNVKVVNLLSTNPDIRVAYGYSEKHESTGTATFDDWMSEARLSRDGSSWIISANKNYILHDDYDKYLIFCKTKDYEDVLDYVELKKVKPYGVVALLLDKTQIPEVSFLTENNIDYQKIRVEEVVIPRDECEVISPTKYGQRILTCKGMGQLAVASVILGKIKCTLDSCIHYLTTYRPDRLKNSEFLQWIFFQARNRVLAVETVVYMTAGIIDSFDEASEIHLEPIISKILAVNYGHDALKMIQMLYGQDDNLITATQEDQINLWEGFLEGTYHNTLLLGLSGLKQYGMYQHEHIHKLKLPLFYPSYKFKTILDDWRKYEGKFNSDLSLVKHFSYNLEDPAESLEKCIKKLEFLSGLLLQRWVKEIPSHQVDVTRMGQMATLLYTCLALFARATMHQRGQLFGYSDMCRSAIISVFENMAEFEHLYQQTAIGPYESGDKIFDHIHSRNMKFGGYFAFSPLDKNLY